jgi:hypothetical protein
MGMIKSGMRDNTEAKFHETKGKTVGKREWDDFLGIIEFIKREACQCKQ